MKKIFLFGVLLFVGLFSGESTFAKSYTYDSIDVDIVINKDATFSVKEKQTFVFEGSFTKGWREIPIREFDRIKDIKIYSEDENRYLEYKRSLSEEYTSKEEGQYSHKKQNGAYQIWWFYDAKDEVRTWTISYTVVGGISFLEDKDELYWNILTDYDVPIESSEVSITIPDVGDQSPIAFTKDDLRITQYLSGGLTSSSRVIDSQTAVASALSMQPNAQFTVAFGFPRGIIDRGEYWKDFWMMYWGYFGGAFLLLATIVWVVLYWYLSEKHHKGRGTIIAEYEPPHHLPPALGEVIVKEKMSRKTWPATIVDLAVRGYVTIEEDPKGVIGRMLSKALPVLGVAGFLSVWVVFFFNFDFSEEDFLEIFMIMILVFFVSGMVGWGIFKKSSGSKDYTLTLVQEGKRENLQLFEKKLLNVLFFGRKNVFSTKEMRSADKNTKRGMYESFKTLKKTLYQEVDKRSLYINSLSGEEEGRVLLFFSLFFFIWGMAFFAFLGSIYFFFGAVVFSVLLVVYMLKFEVKLNKQGNIEREKWLGFKEFLYRVHRYRVQDLTPETFQKYLPYAMIFGMEKQWAKHFEGIVEQPPSWYSAPSANASYGQSSFGGGVSSFSAGAFSASLSSSFVSTFSSSSGSSGASGGGGSAGGGGGGGGGGAS
jgi:uncharacterized membrane protein